MLVPSGAIQKAVSPFLVPNMKLDRFMFMEMRGQFFSFCTELKCVCVCVCMYVCMYVCVCVCVCVYIYIYIHTHTHTVYTTHIFM
jgi:hypothetical protein